MALFQSSDTFAYIDLNDRIVRVDGTDVTDRGAWSASALYVPGEVILFSNGLFVCLVGNTNQPPTAIRDDFWSSLVKTTIPQADLTLELVYALALEALSLAGDTFQIATSGTLLAYTALQTAWAGTNLAYLALQTAWVGTNNGTSSGTNGGGSSSGTFASTDSVYAALVTAWVGTATANVALNVASQGTNEAAGAITIGNKALTTAWVGTNEAAAAIALANQALSLAFVGTTAGGGPSAQSYLALQTAWSGTALAYQALQTAWSGTSSGSAAIQLANHATQLAWVGTNALPTTGGVITGDLTIAGGKFDAANGTFADKLYTEMLTAQTWRNTHVALTYGTIVNIDYSRGSAFTLACQGDVQFTDSNRVDGAIAKVAIFTGLGTTSFTWPGWVNIGTPLPDLLLGGKHAIVSLECYGATVGDVWATYETEV